MTDKEFNSFWVKKLSEANSINFQDPIYSKILYEMWNMIRPYLFLESRMKNGPNDINDIEMIAFVAFDRAVKSFDNSKGIAFYKYAKTAVRWALRVEYNLWNADSRSSENIISFEDQFIEVFMSNNYRFTQDTEFIIIFERAWELVVEKVRDGKRTKEAKAFEYWLTGETQTAIAKRFGVTKMSIHYWLENIKNRLMKEFEREGIKFELPSYSSAG